MTTEPARRAPDATTRREQGQVAPLALVALLFAAVLAVGVVRVGDAAGRAASAQASADAAALAGAADGRGAAVEVASANGAQVVSFAQIGDDVRVTVERRGATATARARWLAAPIP
jgi:hypothetical protein